MTFLFSDELLTTALILRNSGIGEYMRKMNKKYESMDKCWIFYTQRCVKEIIASYKIAIPFFCKSVAVCFNGSNLLSSYK